MFSPEGYQALRHGAGLVRRGDRGILSVTGADRQTWLQGLLTNDVVSLPIGGIIDAAYLTPQGRMLTDMRVFNLPDRMLLDVPGSLAEALRARLDALLFSEDANIADLSREVVILDVHGRQAPSIVAMPGNGDPALDVPTAADDAYGIPGYSLFVPATSADLVASRLVARGALETTLATLDVIRVEAGRPAFLIDMDEHTIPLEAGLEARAISFTKGCYVGQEVIVRVMQRGQGRVAKRLVGLLLAKSEPPAAGDPILGGDSRAVGRITSAVWSPTLERGIALGYVHREFVQAGTWLTVRSGAVEIAAEVSTLPFVHR